MQTPKAKVTRKLPTLNYLLNWWLIFATILLGIHEQTEPP